MQYVDLWFWLVGDILLKTDKMAMAHSLESRVPFLDREVFDLAASIPTVQKVTDDQTKVTLREAAERTIPRDWAQKEKLGFPVPVVSWLREPRYYEQVKRVFTSEARPRGSSTWTSSCACSTSTARALTIPAASGSSTRFWSGTASISWTVEGETAA